MPSTQYVWSIRKILLIAVVCLVTLLSTISVGLMTSQYSIGMKKQVVQNVKHWTNLLAEKSSPYLVRNDSKSLKNNLTLPAEVPSISHIHIYLYDQKSNEHSLFYSYKKSQRSSAIQEKVLEKMSLSEPRFNLNYVEYMQAITYNNNIVGLIYLQSNVDYINPVTKQLLITSVLIILGVLLIMLFVAFQLERHITAPMMILTTTIQSVSRQKNYQVTCPAMPYREIDILARNINILFARTEKQILQLGVAEQQSIEHSHELEDKVNKRTQALKESNQELLSTLEKLHQFQGQLVESEKMASLGDMVAGVAHEVNTPIGLGVTASTLLADRLDKIKSAFEDKTLKSSQLKKFLDEGSENIAIIYRNLNRAADLISSFKKVAVDQSSENIREFNIKELLSEVLLTLRPQLSNLPYKVSLNCPKELTVYSKPGPINQILINLVMNSIIHGFEGRDNGNITITVMDLGNQLNLIFTDDGRGVDEAIRNKIFDPFTTTKRGEGGSGLGMHLVYNLVTQALGGTISLTSEVNQGVSIEINFPIN